MLMVALLVGIFLVSMLVIGWLWLEFRKESDLAKKQAVEAGRVAQVSVALQVKDDQLKQMQIELKAAQDKNVANEEMISKLKASVVDESVLAHLRAENVAFKAQLDEVSLKLKNLQEEASSREAAFARERVETEGLLEQMHGQIAALKLQSVSLDSNDAGLRDKVDALSGKVRELEASLATQLEKNEYLQYELTKSRAQVVGLERLYGVVTTGVGS